MSEPVTHTPTPWALSVEEEEGEPGCGVIHIPDISRSLHDGEWASRFDWDRDLANARFIVKAVNMHAGLIAALEAVAGEGLPHTRICGWWDTKTPGGYFHNDGICDCFLSRIAAALKSAKG